MVKVIQGKRPVNGLPAAPTIRARAEPHGPRQTSNSPAAADLPENTAVAPSLRWGSRKWTATVASGAKPWTSKWPSRPLVLW
jgi:hypothetical protein